MMKDSLLHIIILTIYFAGGTFGQKWHYEEQGEWPKPCLNGKHQSPIDLSKDLAEGVNFPPLTFQNYDEFYNVNVKNNGHTIEIRLNSSNRPTISGGGLWPNEYFLDSLHFHWMSEHTIDGTRYPLELHLVHYGTRFRDVSHALAYNGVAVLGVLFYESPDDDVELLPLIEAMRAIERSRGNPMIQTRLELDDFIPRDRAGFYRYNGSLTTPPCTEAVTWTVFTNGLPISTSQLKVFSQLVSEENQELKANYRILQELNDRKILLKVSGMDSAAGMKTPIQIWSLPALLVIVMFLA